MTEASREVLTMARVRKTFPGVLALDEANLSVRAGEIHGLVGENGAGKSTIIKALAGIFPRDSGEIAVDSVPFDEVTPSKVHAAGVRFVHQELNLVPHFTVAETVFMGQELQGPLGLRVKAMRRAAEQFLEEALNAHISGRKLARDLGVAERKLVQIARALIDDQAKIVVFDEPTAPLASAEIEHLFEAIARLKRRGIAMVYVSHYLGEIASICDRVTVFRNGRDVGVVDGVGPQDAPRIISMMGARSPTSIRRATTIPAARCSHWRSSATVAISEPSTSRSKAARSSASPACSARGASSWFRRSTASSARPRGACGSTEIRFASPRRRARSTAASCWFRATAATTAWSST
jgi:ribose transport system ATP-binding protein